MQYKLNLGGAQSNNFLQFKAKNLKFRNVSAINNKTHPKRSEVNYCKFNTIFFFGNPS